MRNENHSVERRSTAYKMATVEAFNETIKMITDDKRENTIICHKVPLVTQHHRRSWVY